MLVIVGSLCAVPAARAADQTVAEAGNAASATVAGASPLVRSAMRRLEQVLETVRDRDLREQTADALFNPQTCVQHRSGLTAAKKQTILDMLLRESLYTATDATAFPGGAAAGVFPPVRAGEKACPKLPQAFYATPGSNFGSHHSYPGGLAIHEGFNVSSALNIAENYKLAYGTPGSDRLPRGNAGPGGAGLRGGISVGRRQLPDCAAGRGRDRDPAARGRGGRAAGRDRGRLAAERADRGRLSAGPGVRHREPRRPDDYDDARLGLMSRNRQLKGRVPDQVQHFGQLRDLAIGTT